MDQKNSSGSESEESAEKKTGVVLRKKGKFSNRESELIVKTVKDFVTRWQNNETFYTIDLNAMFWYWKYDSNGLTVGDLCSKLRENGACVARHQVWNELANLLPHRDRKCIQHHAHRQLVKGNFDLEPAIEPQSLRDIFFPEFLWEPIAISFQL